MHLHNIIRILGILLLSFSSTVIPSIFIAYYYVEPDGCSYYLLTMAVIATIGLSLWLPCRTSRTNIRIRDGFLIVTFAWLLLSTIAALPFIFSPHNISWVDAVFEATSGLTATGSTILYELDSMPRSLLYYRQQLQFIGGMGIILLAVAILPALGTGGMQLFRAEVTGPSKDNKLVPKIAQYAKNIWQIYLSLTVFCALSYWSAGMEWFDAISYGFSTVSTGGFATHDASIGYFANNNITLISIFFMLLSSINFSLHFLAMARGGIRYYWHDIECRYYLSMIIIAIIVVSAALYIANITDNLPQTLLEAAFAVTAFATTTGLAISDINSWPLFLSFFLLALGIIGGCGGSTSGGIKVIRAILLCKHAARELKRLLHPHAYYDITIKQRAIPTRTMDAIAGFIILYIMLFAIITLSLLLTGVDFASAFAATAATISNIGPGLGSVVQNFSELSDAAKIILSGAMILGRLEIFTALVLLFALQEPK
ncbi:MAG: potassium transporter [Legionellales bacterium]|nr:MAG: potassium transporter [Legionellales bacterium]